MSLFRTRGVEAVGVQVASILLWATGNGRRIRGIFCLENINIQLMFDFCEEKRGDRGRFERSRTGGGTERAEWGSDWKREGTRW